MIRIERVSQMMVLYNDEEQGTGGYCDLLKPDINRLQFQLGLTKKQCRIVYERLLSYQVLLFDTKSKVLLREHPGDNPPKPIYIPQPRNNEDAQVIAINTKIEGIFKDQTDLRKKSIVGVQQEL